MPQPSHYSVAVKEHGRVNLPRELRRSLDLQEGDALIFQVRPDGSAVVTTQTAAARRGRGIFAHLKTEASETDTFLAERRAEAEQ